LSIEERPEGQLVVEGGVVEYAKKLFNEKEYFGAFAVLHALIEFWMQNVYENDYKKRHGSLKFLVEYEMLKKNYRYWELRDWLKKLKIIDSKEVDRINAFGDLRNRIIHRLVKYCFMPQPQYIVTKKEVDQGFNEGIALVEMLSTKNRQLILS